MKFGITPKSIAVAFFGVLALYVAVFLGIEHLRQRKGPWEVRFHADAQGSPVVTVAQGHLQLSNISIVFHGERVIQAPETVRFDRVLRPVPYGKVIYEDLTFLPGVVTFDLFGHEIELLPRVLIVNKQPVPWLSGERLELWPSNKLAIPPAPPKHR